MPAKRRESDSSDCLGHAFILVCVLLFVYLCLAWVLL